MKKMLCCAFFLLILGHCVTVFAQCPSPSVIYGSRKTPLIEELGANRYGLTRSWYNQVRVHRAVAEVEHFLLHQGTIFAVSTDSRLHAIDAETGATLWIESLGLPSVICQMPSANSRMVGLIAGMDLIILDRVTGKRIFETAIHGVVGSGCVLSEKYVYVPQVTGRIMAWPLVEVVEESLLDAPADETPVDVDEERDAHDEALARIKQAVESAKAALIEKDPPKETPTLRLEAPKSIPVECQSFGTVFAPPEIATQNYLDEYVSWPTIQGDLYIGSIGESTRDQFDLLYKARISPQAMFFQFNSAVESDWVVRRDIYFRPTYCPPIFLDENGFLDENPDNPIVPKVKTFKNRNDTTDIFGQESLEDESEEDASENERAIPNMVLVGNAAGYVVAVNDLDGSVLWSYAMTNPVSQRVAAIKNRVYACSFGGGMYALEAKTGKELWFSPGVENFIAESANHIYVTNIRREIAILDRKDGKVLSAFCAIPFDYTIENHDTDRIYLVTKTGLIQSLHEIAQVTPLKHRPTSADLVAYTARLVEKARGEKSDRPRPEPVTPPSGVGSGGFEEDDSWDTDSDDDAGFGGDDSGFGSDGFDEDDFDFE